LGARTQGQFDEQWPAAEQELAAIFDAGDWGLNGRVDLYTQGNIANLWRNELTERIRGALEDAEVGQGAFGDWLQDVHYVYVSAHSKALFGEHYQENKGWRVLAISVPALGVGAAGIASHYQQGQKHNRLGEVSNLLYDHAEAALAKSDIELPGRKIVKADWDGAGLMRQPATELCGVQLPAGETARLKYARTTTVKKILASFIDVQPLDLSSPGLGTALEGSLVALEKAGRALA
jgi:5-methylcytosine-specific restriction protein B